MRRLAAIALLVLAACSSGSPPTSSPAASPSSDLLTMTGTFEVSGAGAFKGCNDTPGRLQGGYSDIGEGTAVTVYNDTGKIVASTALTNPEGATAGGNGYCRFSFTVEVPAFPFYQVEVSHRGRITVQQAEIADVKLTLGG